MTAKVVQFKSHADRNVGAFLEHLTSDKPDTGILITRSHDAWRWDFYGEAKVTEMLGALEVVKHDILDDYAAFDDESG